MVKFCYAVDLILPTFALQTNLAMTAMGSKGQTFTQIKSALHLPSNLNAIASQFHNALEPLQFNNSQLKVLQRIYLQEGEEHIQTDFIQHVHNDFFSDVIEVNFENSNSTTESINEWATYRTNNLIHNIVTPTMIDITTQMLLVNTILFESVWDIPFNPEDTSFKNFYLTSTNVKQIETMHISVSQ